MTPADTLRSHGLTVDDSHLMPGRPYTWTPGAIMYHWTGSRPSPSNPTPALRTITQGRTGVPAPLYQWLLGGDAVWRWISDGRANHAGAGNRSALEAALAGEAPTVEARLRGLQDTPGAGGNRWTVGMSVEHDGSAPLSGAVREAFVRGIASLATHYGWTPGHTFGHSAYTRRKIDFPTDEMQLMRSEIREDYKSMTEPSGAPVADVIDPGGTAQLPGRVPFWTVYDTGRVESHNGARQMRNPITFRLNSPVTGAHFGAERLVLTARGDGGTFALRPQ